MFEAKEKFKIDVKIYQAVLTVDLHLYWCIGRFKYIVIVLQVVNRSRQKLTWRWVERGSCSRKPTGGPWIPARILRRARAQILLNLFYTLSSCVLYYLFIT
jgi:hypothetical protein